MFEKLIAALQLTLLMGINLSYNNYDVLLPTTVYVEMFVLKTFRGQNFRAWVLIFVVLTKTKPRENKCMQFCLLTNLN